MSTTPLLPRRGLLAWLRGADSGWLLAEALLAGVLVAAAAVLIGFSTTLSLAGQISLWLAWAAVAAGLRLLGFFRLVGPVFVFDLLRSSRRRRTFLFRLLYAAFLFFLLVWVYAVSWRAPSLADIFSPPVSVLARLAASFFSTFLTTQFLIVVALTPAYTAGAIAEEKERKTLPFVLATTLDDREIVLGKLASRLLHIVMYLLAGLPILSALLLFGGIDPGLLLAGMLATVVTVLSVGALSISSSVALKRGRDAMMATYGIAAGYLILTCVLTFGLMRSSWASFPSTATWTSPVTLGDVADWLAAGNVLVALMKLSMAAGGNVSAVVPELLRNYVLFHLLTAALFAFVAVARLRPIALREDAVRGQRHRLWTRLFGRPAVGDRPMIWKEVFAEPGPRRHPLARIVLGVLVGLSFLPVGMILYNLLDEAEYAPMTAADFSWRLSMAMSIWVRIVGTAVASLLLLHVAVRAASSIGVERERQTLDSLLTTPLSTDDILHGKLLGSVLGQRWAWLWLAAIYLVGVIGGGVNILALPLILGAWLIFAMFFGVLGLWFAAVSRTTTRAVVSTVLAALALGGGHWLLWFCCSCPMIFLRSGSGFGPPWELMKWALMFQSFGLTPSITLAALAFRLTELDPSRYGPFFWSGSFLGEVVICILLGLFVWGVATKVLWSALTIRFAQRVRPTPIRRRPR